METRKDPILVQIDAVSIALAIQSAAGVLLSALVERRAVSPRRVAEICEAIGPMVPQDDQVRALARFTIRGLHDVALFLAGDRPPPPWFKGVIQGGKPDDGGDAA